MRWRNAHTTAKLLILTVAYYQSSAGQTRRLLREPILAKYEYSPLSEGVVFVRLVTKRGVP